MTNFSIAEIEEMLDNENFTAEMKPVVEILLYAINDWPEPVDNLYDYESAVQKFIMNPTTKSNINVALHKIDVANNAWQAESLTSLVEVFEHFENDVSLKEIIENILQDKSPE